jgi:hypothetical protein
MGLRIETEPYLGGHPPRLKANVGRTGSGKSRHTRMDISEAQLEVRTRFLGGFYRQVVADGSQACSRVRDVFLWLAFKAVRCPRSESLSHEPAWARLWGRVCQNSPGSSVS